MDATPTRPSPGPLRRARRPAQRAAPFVATAAFVVAILYRIVIFRESLYWGDIFLYFLPLQEFVASSFRSGRLPLWNPYVLCGQPLVGNPQSWVFYPIGALSAVLPPWVCLTVSTVLHLVFAGLGTYLFLRRVCGDRLAAILGAIVYTGSGYLIARLQFPPMAQSAAYLPWLLLLVDRIIDRPRVAYAGLCALMVALELLAGHPQIAYLTFACTCLYAAARLWHLRRHGRRALQAAAGIVTALLLGIVAGAAQWVPALQLFQVSTRENLTWGQANRFVFLPEQLVNFIAPDFYGSPARAGYWGPGNAWEPCVYVGLPALALAGYALWCASRRAVVRFFSILGLVALWLAMGKYGGLFWLAFYVVPGLRSFHDPARFTFLTTFALAALAAVGLRALRDRHVGNGWRVALVVATAANLWWFDARFNPTLDAAGLAYRPRVMALTPRQGTGRVFTAERDEVWRRYLSYSDYGPDSTRYAHELTDTLAPNVGMRFAVEEGSGYEPVPIRAVTEVDGLVRAALARHEPNLTALLSLFNTRLLLLPESTRYLHPGLEPQLARGVTALAVGGPPRTWLVRRTMRVDGTERTLAALSGPAFDPRTCAIVSGTDGLGESSLWLSDSTPPAAVRRYRSTPLSCTVDADAGQASAFLVWSAAAYPGWTVAVDGTPARIERTNHAFLGVTVPPGAHRVVFEYRPFVVRFALFASLLGLCAISAMLGYGAVGRSVDRHAGALRASTRGIAAVSAKLSTAARATTEGTR